MTAQVATIVAPADLAKKVKSKKRDKSNLTDGALSAVKAQPQEPAADANVDTSKKKKQKVSAETAAEPEAGVAEEAAMTKKKKKAKTVACEPATVDQTTTPMSQAELKTKKKKTAKAAESKLVSEPVAAPVGADPVPNVDSKLKSSKKRKRDNAAAVPAADAAAPHTAEADSSVKPKKVILEYSSY